MSAAAATRRRGTRFEVWAPRAGTVTVELDGRSVPLQPDHAAGTWVGIVDGRRARRSLPHPARRRGPAADPASGWQPDGVFGASAVVDAGQLGVDRRRAGRRVALDDAVLYELHVGTFTPAGHARRRRSTSSTASPPSASRTSS